jgi:hypothetical protein
MSEYVLIYKTKLDHNVKQPVKLVTAIKSFKITIARTKRSKGVNISYDHELSNNDELTFILRVKNIYLQSAARVIASTLSLV